MDDHIWDIGGSCTCSHGPGGLRLGRMSLPGRPFHLIWEPRKDPLDAYAGQPHQLVSLATTVLARRCHICAIATVRTTPTCGSKRSPSRATNILEQRNPI